MLHKHLSLAILLFNSLSQVLWQQDSASTGTTSIGTIAGATPVQSSSGSGSTISSSSQTTTSSACAGTLSSSSSGTSCHSNCAGSSCGFEVSPSAVSCGSSSDSSSFHANSRHGGSHHSRQTWCNRSALVLPPSVFALLQSDMVMLVRCVQSAMGSSLLPDNFGKEKLDLSRCEPSCGVACTALMTDVVYELYGGITNMSSYNLSFCARIDGCQVA